MGQARTSGVVERGVAEASLAELDVRRWDGRELEWKEKPFLKDHIRSFLHIPLSFRRSLCGRSADRRAAPSLLRVAHVEERHTDSVRCEVTGWTNLDHAVVGDGPVLLDQPSG